MTYTLEISGRFLTQSRYYDSPLFVVSHVAQRSGVRHARSNDFSRLATEVATTTPVRSQPRSAAEWRQHAHSNDFSRSRSERLKSPLRRLFVVSHAAQRSGVQHARSNNFSRLATEVATTTPVRSQPRSAAEWRPTRSE